MKKLDIIFTAIAAMIILVSNDVIRSQQRLKT